MGATIGIFFTIEGAIFFRLVAGRGNKEEEEEGKEDDNGDDDVTGADTQSKGGGADVLISCWWCGCDTWRVLVLSLPSPFWTSCQLALTLDPRLTRNLLILSIQIHCQTLPHLFANK